MWDRDIVEVCYLLQERIIELSEPTLDEIKQSAIAVADRDGYQNVKVLSVHPFRLSTDFYTCRWKVTMTAMEEVGLGTTSHLVKVTLVTIVNQLSGAIYGETPTKV
jgi:hypothetical protein